MNGHTSSERNFDANPWHVSSLEEFCYYFCPECHVKTQDHNQFFNHAVQSHRSASVLKDIFPDMVTEEYEEYSELGHNQCDMIDPSVIKQELNEDDFSELEENTYDDTEMDTEQIKEEDEEEFDENEQISDTVDTSEELVYEDIPLLQIPSGLSKDELFELFETYNIPLVRDQVDIKKKRDLEKLLACCIKNHHPLRQHLARLTLSEKRAFHKLVIGEPSESIRVRGKRIEAKLLSYYFKKHKKSPLKTFLKDKRKLEEEAKQESNKVVHKKTVCVNKSDSTDPSIVVDLNASRHQMIEELKSFGIDGTNIHHSHKRVRIKLAKFKRKYHPIHQAITSIGMEEMKALLWYGEQIPQRGVIKMKRQLAKMCFIAQPESPLAYLTYLQNQYQSVGKTAHKQEMKQYRAELRKQRREAELVNQHEEVNESENSAMQNYHEVYLTN